MNGKRTQGLTVSTPFSRTLQNWEWWQTEQDSQGQRQYQVANFFANKYALRFNQWLPSLHRRFYYGSYQIIFMKVVFKEPTIIVHMPITDFTMNQHAPMPSVITHKYIVTVIKTIILFSREAEQPTVPSRLNFWNQE